MTVPIESLWTPGPTDLTTAGRLREDRSADVVVVGGGAAGLSVATHLHEAGAEVIVLERHRVGAGITGGSTAKVTALHGIQLTRIRRRHGAAAARDYAAMNSVGLEAVRATVDRYGIGCELTEAAAVDYAVSREGRDLLDREMTYATAAGLPVELRETADLPFPVRGAIVLAGQAHLHPRLWCEGLARVVGGDRIHEGTAARRVDEAGDHCVVVTDGGSVRAEHAVIATHAPIVDPRYLTVRCRPHRSYALAARIDGEPPPDMYLSVDEPVRSLRPAHVDGQAYLVVAGEGHPVGDEHDALDRLAALEAWTREHFPVRSVAHRWAAHDQMPADDLPFIGRLAPGSRRWVATGFQKWGLTTSAAAAVIVGDGILGRSHPAAPLVDPARLRSTLTTRLAADVGRVASRYVGDHLRSFRARLDGLAAGDGVVVRLKRGDTAVHRDAGGNLHAVSAVCTHEGCLVRFNRAQESWDCPCHGSRFSVDGEVLTGPAVADLPQVDLPDD